ncbi:MAG: SixA phosphatase family protein [Gammaproteobacteria bacterium]
MNHANRLLLMRHAKSDWFSGAGEDFLRPLAERGTRDARRMGRWLAASGYLPDSVLSSPSRRTRQTVALLSAGAGVDLAARTAWCEPLYLGSVESLLAELAHHGKAGGVMIVGHNPGLEDFLEWLLPRDALPNDHAKRFPTGAIYVLESDAEVSALGAGSARLVEHQRPKMLTD